MGDKKLRVVDLLQLIGFIVICEVAGIIGSFFTISEIGTWYQTLAKPFFTPPNWVFGPVWTSLYFLMGMALFLVFKYSTKSARQKKIVYLWFGVQLVFNVLWSMVFFGLHNPSVGLVVIVILWGLIFETVRLFSLHNRYAGSLLVPYLLWVTYATALNTAIVWLN